MPHTLYPMDDDARSIMPADAQVLRISWLVKRFVTMALATPGWVMPRPVRWPTRLFMVGTALTP